MKKLILAILAILITLTTFSFGQVNYWNQDDDKPYFQQRDNQAHIAFGAAVSAGVTYYAIEELELTELQAWLLGVAVVTLIGAGKEHFIDSKFDKEDLSGYVLGGAMGSSITIISIKF